MRDGRRFRSSFDNGKRGDSFLLFLLKGCIAIGNKLQGKSLKYVVMNSFKNFGHWAYVALSRVKALNGLFLRSPVDFSKCTGMDNQVRQFMDRMKDKRIDDTYLFVLK
jgi:hypothetical protein